MLFTLKTRAKQIRQDIFVLIVVYKQPRTPTLVKFLSDFTNEFSVTQRDVVEVALAEFFKKYGCTKQLNGA